MRKDLETGQEQDKLGEGSIVHSTERPSGKADGKLSMLSGSGQASSLDLFSESGSVSRISQTCQLCEFTLLPAVWPLCRLPFHAPTPKGPEKGLP